MTSDQTHGEILQNLREILASVPVSEDLKETADALISRLSSPVRVTFAGPPKVGKSTLINALAKQPVIPEGVDLPTFEAWYSETPHIIATKSDGTTTRIDGIDFQALADIAPVFLQFYMPLDILKRIRVLEVVTDGSPEELHAATAWAAKRSDIFIWCSRHFDETEQDLWSRLPQAIQDHGFLVLTQADLWPRDMLTTQLDSLCADVGDTFRLIAPVAALHALQAQLSNRPDKEDQIKASGLSALRSELLRDINLGRQADLDHVSMLLRRFEVNSRLSRPRPLPDALTESKLAQLSASQDTGQTASKQAFTEGADYLRDQASIMLIDIEELGRFAPKRIVERCHAAADGLMDLIVDSYASAETEELALDAATEAADVLLLMSMESTEEAAEDAVSLLLQLQRDFEAAAAA